MELRSTKELMEEHSRLRPEFLRTKVGLASTPRKDNVGQFLQLEIGYLSNVEMPNSETLPSLIRISK